MGSEDDVFGRISTSLVKLDEETVLSDVRSALKKGIDPGELLARGLVQGLNEIGRQFEDRSIFLPELMVAAEIANEALDIVVPYMQTDIKNAGQGRVVIGTVRGDVHDIGKNIVVSLLRATGFEVRDLGVDVDPEIFAEAARDCAADVVGLSALISTAASAIHEAVTLLKQQHPAAKVIVGGAATTDAAAAAWGADAYARDAWAGVERIRELAMEATRA